MDKHISQNYILLYSYFCLHLSLMLCLVWFWCSLLSTHTSFPITSNQFYISAEGYPVYLRARIEQQLITGSLFCKLHTSVAGRRVLHQLHTDFWKASGGICAGEHLGKQSSAQETNHTHQLQHPQANCLTRNLLHFSAVHILSNFIFSLKSTFQVSSSKKKIAI